MMAFVYGGIIYAVTVAGNYLVQYLDEPTWKISKKVKLFVTACSVTNGVVIVQLDKKWCMNDGEAVLLAVLAGCLLFACLTDVKTCYVYQFTWWLAGVTGGLLLWSREKAVFRGHTFSSDVLNAGGLELRMADWILPLLSYILLQELFFCRFYGRADSHAYVVCAVTMSAFGMGMQEYLMHMILAFTSLAVVQALCGNINHKGVLKQPVAFIPYITLSLWLLLFF